MAISEGIFSYQTALGASSYGLTFRYNARMDKWILDVEDAGGNLLVRGIPVIGDIPLLSRLYGRMPGLPSGILAAIDMGRLGRDPSENTLNTDFMLAYLP